MNEMISSSLKVGLSTVATLIGWVVATKLLSVQLGAVGVGLFGLLRQLLQNLNSPILSSQATLVQGIAELDDFGQRRYAGVVFRILALFSIALAAILLLGAPWLGPWLIPHPQAPALLRWIALAFLAMGAQTYFTGVLNGHRMVNALVKSQMLGPLVVLALAFPMLLLIRHGQSLGYVVMLAAPAGVTAVSAAVYAWKAGHMPAMLRGGFPLADRKRFFLMSGVLFVSGTITSGAIYFQNWSVAHRLGLAESGNLWTAWTISMTYVTVVLGSYGTYYMPSLARLEDPAARRSLIRNYLHLSLLVLPILICSVIVAKPKLITLMFSSKLLPALKVMRWMLIGDLFKGVSWVMSFPMLAFRKMKWFFWTDLFLFPGLAATSYFWIGRGGNIEGLGVLFMIFYIAYFLVMMFYVFREHGFVWNRLELVRFLCAVVMVAGMSALTWNDVSIHYSNLLVLGFAAPLFAWLPLPGCPSEWRRR